MDIDEHLASQIANLNFLEDAYQSQAKLDPDWSDFFQNLEKEKSVFPDTESSRGESITRLTEAYRHHGHLLALINPIALESPREPFQLNITKLGFKQSHIEELFPTHGLLPQEEAPLKSIIDILQKRYCQTVGFEFKDFTDPALEEWIQKYIESGQFEKPFSSEEKLIILEILTHAEVLEIFLHTKHVGKKRFSLEGAETLIPMLAFTIAKAAKEGVKEICIGMSHRGRLNVLANILHKPISAILKDFDEEYIPTFSEGMGDIRYHKGHANESVNTYFGKSIKLTVTPNPSHLETVDPVVGGQTHAKQYLLEDESERTHIIPFLLHGDAALAGQGIVYESLQMSKLPGFEVGGTLHIAINNQIGFTTSPQEGRSTLYCTDIARVFGSPIFHVNAENPEACVRSLLLGLEIRQKFHCDVFVDLNCYRKYGHNEGDEPAYTQPIEYKIIRKKKSIRTLYLQQLLQEGILEQEKAEELERNIKQHLQDAFDASPQEITPSEESEKIDEPKVYSFAPLETHVDFQLLKQVTEGFSKIPSSFHIHPKLEHLIKERAKVIKDSKPFDWGMAEFLAYGTLVWEGNSVRLVGQDSGRGTFSHRHALWVDQSNNQKYYPLANLRPDQGRFEVLNTCLSEVAALGFEYGYSTVCQGLTIWEAQFGDFVNSAQVVIDQYIASGEQKWGQRSGVVLFLPHGFEGQGPEHSSARFERFLALAGNDNMQIVNPTTPAQLFHLLRRQVKQQHQRPLVVMTPKGLLRHPSCVSNIHELTQGQFSLFLDDPRRPQKARHLILCTGRIYYDLDAQREKEKRDDLAIIRLEQIYPLDIQGLKKLVSTYGDIMDCRWVQEEPENMGAWHFISFYLPQVLPLGIPISYVGRECSASPATGFYARHKQELAHILHQVFKT